MKIKKGDLIKTNARIYKIMSIKKHFSGGNVLLCQNKGQIFAIVVFSLDYEDSFNLKRFEKV